ncbi:MAG: outer membrane lipoprotein-sorting protein [Acidobacteria bacterium SCN 69-37]|nr:MAG: outer membrane lipoprotein-sorting protein [Acidobacteria bacterium SCN 69-37]
MSFRVRWTLLVLAGALVAVGQSPLRATIDGTALLRQVDRRLNPPSYDAYKRLINVEPSGRTREYLLYQVAEGREKVAALFLSPASDKGRSTLRVGDNMWMYVPNAGKPIRITSLQSVIGGVFNNADILSLDYSAEYDVAKVDESGEDYLLELKAKTTSVAYDRLKMWVSQKNTLPVRIECLTPTSMLIKTIYFKDIKDFGGGVIRPAIVETDSPLYKGYKSSMVFVHMKARTFPGEVFTLTFMPNLESIRR